MGAKWLRIDNGANTRLYNTGMIQTVKWDAAGPNHLTVTFARGVDDLSRPDPDGKIRDWILSAVGSDVLNITTNP